MWIVDPEANLETLGPADQIWIIALALEEQGSPAQYVETLRQIADQFERLTWWLQEGRSGGEFGEDSQPRDPMPG